MQWEKGYQRKIVSFLLEKAKNVAVCKINENFVEKFEWNV